MSTQNFLPSSSGENSLGASDLKFSDGYFNSGAFQRGTISETFYLRGKLYPHNFLTIDGLVEESADINVEKYLNFPKWKSGINEDQTLSPETIYRNENVGIGTDDPSARLHVQGNFLVTGDVSVKNSLKISNLDSEDFSLNNEDLIEKTNDAIALTYKESPTTSIVKNDGLNLVRLSSSHPLVTSEFSSLNNNRVYIQSIELDQYGHITGLSDSRELFTNTHVRKEKVEDLILNSVKKGDNMLLRKNSKGELEINSQHPFIASCGDSFNSGRTYLQNLFFDEFGHVQALNSSFESLISDDIINQIVARGEMNSTLVNGEITLSSTHPNITTFAEDSENNSRTYINNLEFDEFGHVVDYSSASETLESGQIPDFILSDRDIGGPNISVSKNPNKNSIIISSSHQTIGSAGDYSLTNREYIKDIKLDSYGHVISVAGFEEIFSERTDLEIYQTVSSSIIAGDDISKSENSQNQNTTISSNHESIESASDSINSGRTYIRSISLDDYGHIKSLTTFTETFVPETNSEIIDCVDRILKGSNINFSKSYNSKLDSLDDVNSFPSNKKVHIQHRNSDVSNITNHGTGGLVKFKNVTFDNNNPLFGQGSLRMGQTTFGALDWQDGQFQQYEDFTIDFWFYKDQNVAGKHEAILGNNSGGGGAANWRILYNHQTDEGIKFIHDNNNQRLNSGPAPLGQWNHLAIERFNNNLYMYLNGVIVSTEIGISKAIYAFGVSGASAWEPLGYLNEASFRDDFRDSITDLGYFPGTSNSYTGFDGYIQDFRIIKGVPVYSGTDFNPKLIISSTHSTKEPLKFLKLDNWIRETVSENDLGSNIFIQDLSFNNHGHIESIFYRERTTDAEILEAFNESLDQGTIQTSINSNKDELEMYAVEKLPDIKPPGFVYLTVDNDFDPNDFKTIVISGGSKVSISFDHTSSLVTNVDLNTKITFERINQGTSRVDYKSASNTLHFLLNATNLSHLADAFPAPGFYHVKADLLSGNGQDNIPFTETFPVSKNFPGIWSLFGAGRTLVGLNPSDTDFDNISETGGSKTHTLTVNEMPVHNHGNTPIMVTDTDAAGGGLIMHLNSSVKESYDPSSPTIWKDLTGNGNHMTLNSVESSNDDLVYNLFFTIGESRASVTFTGRNLDSVTTIKFEKISSGSNRWNLNGSELVLLSINLNNLSDLSSSSPDGLPSDHSLQYGRGLESFDFGQGVVNLNNNNLGLELQKVYSSGLNFDNLNANGATGETKSVYGQYWNPEDQHCMDMWVRFNPIKFRITIYTMNNSGFHCEKITSSPPVRLKFKIGTTWDSTWHDFFTTASKGSVKSKDFTSYYQMPSEVALRNDNIDGYGFWKISITLYDSLSATSGNEHILAEHPSGATGQNFSPCRFWIDGDNNQGSPTEVIFKLNGGDPNRFSNPNTSGVESFSTDTPVVSRWWLGTFGGWHHTGTMHYLRNQFGLWGASPQYAFGLGEDGNWHHIAVQVSHTGYMQWFLDGVFKGESTGSTSDVSNTTSFTNKILDINPKVEYNQGNPDVNISSIRLWNNGLSTQAITFLYNLGRNISLLEDNVWRGLYDTRSSGQTTNSGGNQPHNNLQPYKVVKMWKRDS